MLISSNHTLLLSSGGDGEFGRSLEAAFFSVEAVIEFIELDDDFFFFWGAGGLELR